MIFHYLHAPYLKIDEEKFMYNESRYGSRIKRCDMCLRTEARIHEVIQDRDELLLCNHRKIGDVK